MTLRKQENLSSFKLINAEKLSLLYEKGFFKNIYIAKFLLAKILFIKI